ncbi:uncharacterized protein LOC102800927 [Saccoglossus kowalevskii]|uniref:Uncharacterized protein LOC102800927 n=1 Tax=Saccoglossus kowalevskii TaxID=10224 RepID=A0ABM0M8M4_SACKO|nr:PREDICTED: uncharacterized protein LOC102800927 [Saccoglossus kowalevskii]
MHWRILEVVIVWSFAVLDAYGHKLNSESQTTQKSSEEVDNIVFKNYGIWILCFSVGVVLAITVISVAVALLTKWLCKRFGLVSSDPSIINANCDSPPSYNNCVNVGIITDGQCSYELGEDMWSDTGETPPPSYESVLAIAEHQHMQCVPYVGAGHLRGPATPHNRCWELTEPSPNHADNPNYTKQNINSNLTAENNGDNKNCDVQFEMDTYILPR